MSVPWKPTNAMREVELRTDYIERTMAEHRPIDNGTLAHLMQAVEDYKARVAELEAIVSRLPVTADGVPVVPGMKVWAAHRGVAHEMTVQTWGERRGVCSYRTGDVNHNLVPSEAYSTPQAARQSATPQQDNPNGGDK